MSWNFLSLFFHQTTSPKVEFIINNNTFKYRQNSQFQKSLTWWENILLSKGMGKWECWMGIQRARKVLYGGKELSFFYEMTNQSAWLLDFFCEIWVQECSEQEILYFTFGSWRMLWNEPTSRSSTKKQNRIRAEVNTDYLKLNKFLLLYTVGRDQCCR